MGGCCCSANGPELTVPAGYNHCSRTSGEQVSLPAHHGTAVVPSPGLLVDTSLDNSISDTYRSLPVPAPYDVVLGHPQSPRGTDTAAGDKSDTASDTAGKTANSGSAQETAADDKTRDNSVKCEDLILSHCKELSDYDMVKEQELEKDPLKSVEPVVVEECPTCLEEYDADNPKIITKCEHHFHLACILEWLERSDTCPVCDQEMVFDPPVS